MEIIERPAFRLAGIKLAKKTFSEGGQSGIDCGNLWQQFEKGKYFDKIIGKINDEIYAVYYDYEGDHTKPYSYFIGCIVPADSEIPEGMDSINVAGGSYNRVIATGKMPDCVASAWKGIWKSATGRAYQYDYEVYDGAGWDWNNATVPIFISSNL